MDTLSKLDQERILMLEAGKLLKQAMIENQSLEKSFGAELLKIASMLERFSDYSDGFGVMEGVPIITIIESHGTQWQLENVPNDAIKNQVVVEDSYFPETLRKWITDTLSTDQKSTNSELVKLFIEVGVDKDIARFIIAREREKCRKKGHIIDFSEFEPVDDRIFTSSNMFDFTNAVAQEAISAGFEGRKSIANLSIERYINNMLELQTGDGSAESWIPKNEWPTEASVTTRLATMKKEAMNTGRVPGKRRKI